MDTASRAVLQPQTCQWSLPPNCLRMPAGFRRWCSLYHLDGLHFRIRRFLQLQATLAYHPETLSKLHAMDRLRAREKRVTTRASREVVFASAAGWSREWRGQIEIGAWTDQSKTVSWADFALGGLCVGGLKKMPWTDFARGKFCIS